MNRSPRPMHCSSSSFGLWQTWHNYLRLPPRTYCGVCPIALVRKVNVVFMFIQIVGGSNLSRLVTYCLRPG